MAGNIYDPKHVIISYDGYTISASEFADADVEITAGGDNTEVVKGKAGGHATVEHYDKVDSVTFTLFEHAENAYRLENYHNQHKQIENLIVKVIDPVRQRTWTSTAVNVKGYDAVAVTTAGGFAFTLECEEDFKIG